MDVTCPHCEKSFSVPDEQHYEMLDCEICGRNFQVLTDETVKISREFLQEMLKERPPE